MLPADEQEVIWIDGLSIELNKLSPELEPVGICVAINANKAIVRYKEEYNNIRWADSIRLKLDDAAIIDLITKCQPVSIEINGKLQSNQLSLTGVSSRQDFVNRLNEYFIANNLNDFSAELAELDTDLTASDTSDEKDGDSYRNRIIVNNEFTENNGWKTITIGEDSGTNETAKHIKSEDFAFLNNGFCKCWLSDPENEIIPACKALLYDCVIPELSWVSDAPLDSINYFVTKNDFESNENCQILRDNFASYDDYLDSLLVKVPCGVGEIGENPSGKENTYKLSDCKYAKLNGDQEYLYPAARKAASIHVNGPKLTAGNWWLPSTAEMAQMMRDITYETSFWDSKPDIVNRVIEKIRKVDDNWTYMSASTMRCTSSKAMIEYVWVYNGNSEYYAPNNSGSFVNVSFMDLPYLLVFVTPITIYEF